MRPSPRRPATPRRVVVVGGGASGTLVAAQALRHATADVEVVVVEPRETLGQGVAFGTPDPWHRLNVPAITMSALPDDLEHFVRWSGADPGSFPPRAVFGRYLGAVLAEAAAGSPGVLRHVRDRATRFAPGRGTAGEGTAAGRGTAAGLRVALASGEVLEADAVVLATGNELPAVPGFVAGLAAGGDARFVRDPWAPGGLDGVADGELVAIVGTGHTALDLCASLLRTRPAVRTVALSRHGDLPRAHEDPWRPRPPEPAFDVAAFRAFDDPIARAEAAIRAYPGGWRQGLDSLRPLGQQLWLAMDEATRRRFVGEWRRTWEVHRSRLSAGVMREVQAWIAEGRLAVRAGGIERVAPDGPRLRIETGGGDALAVDRVLLATGPDERPASSPLLAAGIADGILRPGPLALGIDADPGSLRVVDRAGASARPVWALGPILRGVLFEVIAIPEIRVQAARIAASVVAVGGSRADPRADR